MMRLRQSSGLAATILLAVTLSSVGCGCGGCGSSGATGDPLPAIVQPDFLVLDENPNSGTYQASVSPRQKLMRVSAWYFGHATWSYCSAQFGHLDAMQADPDLAGLALPIDILGVNGVGYEGGNASICAGRSLPWLQDVAGQNVYAAWQVTYRDVVILDAENRVAGVYNLTSNDLGNQANYDALKTMLIHIASSPPSSP